jgi:hypothetical protein
MKPLAVDLYCGECAREAGRAELARIRQLRKTSAAGA